MFRIFKRFIENQTGKKVQAIHIDNKIEYVNEKLISFLKEEGIKYNTTVPHFPEQNDVVERYNRTIIEKAMSTFWN